MGLGEGDGRTRLAAVKPALLERLKHAIAQPDDRQEATMEHETAAPSASPPDGLVDHQQTSQIEAVIDQPSVRDITGRELARHTYFHVRRNDSPAILLFQTEDGGKTMVSSRVSSDPPYS